MKRIIVAIPHSHTWFWTQTCVASLMRNPPRAEGYEVMTVVVDNSPWSHAIKGITETRLFDMPGLVVIANSKSNKFHASALDFIIEDGLPFDLLMALETDVMALRPTWLQWFVDQLRPTDFAVGMWHHEQFVNPSCTLYRGDVLREMDKWCKNHPDPNVLRWGPRFGKTAPIDDRLPAEIPGDSTTIQHMKTLTQDQEAILKDFKSWIAGPFAEKRGWPAGTELSDQPTGQLKGPGWYEPGQQLHHWAVEAGHTYTICPYMTTEVGGLPVQSLYGQSMPNPQRQLEAEEMFGNAETVHLWGGTRALDILKHPVTCQFVRKHTPGWLAREARFWRQVVPPDVQEATIDLIRRRGWYITGQGSDRVSDRDREAEAFVKECYATGGVVL